MIIGIEGVVLFKVFLAGTGLGFLLGFVLVFYMVLHKQDRRK